MLLRNSCRSVEVIGFDRVGYSTDEIGFSNRKPRRSCCPDAASRRSITRLGRDGDVFSAFRRRCWLRTQNLRPLIGQAVVLVLATWAALPALAVTAALSG
jgi:hypothetical protein